MPKRRRRNPLRSLQRANVNIVKDPTVLVLYHRGVDQDPMRDNIDLDQHLFHEIQDIKEDLMNGDPSRMNEDRNRMIEDQIPVIEDRNPMNEDQNPMKKHHINGG